MNTFTIDGHQVGEGNPCLIIAEVAQAHDGSLGMAHAYIDAVAATGADGVKFQTHIAEAESTPAETFRVQFSQQDATRYEYWKRMEFSEEQWQGLAQHCQESGLIFLSSPFSVEAVELLIRVGMPAWKIPSGEVTTAPMFDLIAQTKRPVLMSTGMSDWAEIDASVERLKTHELPYLIYQCTTSYPCPPEKVGLNIIHEMRERYGCPIGLSDHSGTIYSGLAAVAVGIDMLEVHVTMSREMFGPDVAASVTTQELNQLVQGVRFIEAMLSHPVDKDDLAVEMEPLRRMFYKSIVAAKDLPGGTVLEDQHMQLKKPGTGLPPSRMESLLGRRLLHGVKKNDFIREEDLE
jgi:N,N'-diacetyllegionaminate synthase